MTTDNNKYKYFKGNKSHNCQISKLLPTIKSWSKITDKSVNINNI